MRTLTIAIVLLAAATARAQEIDWKGSWSVDGGGHVLVAGEKKALTAATSFTIGGVERGVTLTGSGTDERLALEGTAPETRGMTGALGGEDAKEKTHRCALAATPRYDEDRLELVVDAKYSVDGAEVRSETWRRHVELIEITALILDGAPLGRTYDVKMADGDRLQVRYRLHGRKALALEARVDVGDGHRYKDFYGKPTIFTKALGTVQPGAGSFEWDGRDQTPAARIALEGPYDVVVAADAKWCAKKGIAVAAPRFEFLSGSSWMGGRDGIDPAVYGPDRTSTMLVNGYQCGDATKPVASIAAVKHALEHSAWVNVETHGSADHATFYTGDPNDPSVPQRQQFVLRQTDVRECDLKDLRVAILNVCESGRGAGYALSKAFLDRGCDVVIAFLRKIDGPASTVFEGTFLALLERGATIAKCKRDAAVVAWRFETKNRVATDEDVRRTIAAEQMSDADHMTAGGAVVALFRDYAREEDDQFWPPRYGDSRD